MSIADKTGSSQSEVIRNGALVFVAGMAMAAASFVVEQYIIKSVKGRA